MILYNLDSYKLYSGTYKCLLKHLSFWCTMAQSVPWQLGLTMSENNRPPQNSHCWTLPIKCLCLLIFHLLQRSELKHILFGIFSGQMQVSWIHKSTWSLSEHSVSHYSSLKVTLCEKVLHIYRFILLLPVPHTCPLCS